MRPLRAAALLLVVSAVCACRGTTQAIDLSDPGIKARIEASLRGRQDLDLRYVVLDVVDGVATVSGMMPTMTQIREVGRVVKRTKGVDSALINLVVNE